MRRFVGVVMLLTVGFWGFAAAAQNPPTDSLDGAPVVVSVQGRFSNQPRWMVNLINAPVTARDNKPPPVDVSRRLLAKLNKWSAPVFEAEIARRGGRVLAALPKGEKSGLRVRVEIGAGNGMGGHDSGLAALVEVRRGASRDPYGSARFELSAQMRPAHAKRELEKAFRQAFGDALDGLRAAEAPTPSKPGRALVVEARTRRLDPRQRTFVARSLLPCLAHRIGASALKEESSTKDGRIRFSMRVTENKGEAWSKRLESFASSFEFAAGRHGKAPCSVWRSPLADYETRTLVESDALRIWWAPPE